MRLATTTTLLVCLTFGMTAQVQWRYIKSIPFPSSDSGFVQPYLCTVTSEGRLYVLSSTLTNASAHNAIWFADSGDTQMKKMVDYAQNGESDTLTGDIGSLRGIAALGKSILVNASIPFQRTSPSTLGAMYYYPDGDTGQVEKLGYYQMQTLIGGSGGHGTFHHGVALTKDSVALAGVSAGAGVAGPRVRSYYYGKSLASPARGAWSSEGQLDPGGAHTGGVDIIRDVAVHPLGDYENSATPFYTSRNSASATSTGGIVIWTGGTQLGMSGYAGTRLSDATGLLSLSPAVAAGITVDRNGYLWVAGIDSTKRWVKAFDASGILATEVADLPSQNNQDGFSADPNGAPMIAPVDVALTPDGLTAYVPDAVARVVYQFKYTGPTSVSTETSEPRDFTLYQNYPNPFNPSTMIAFSLPGRSEVRLTVSNMLGQTVATLVAETLPAGNHHRFFNAQGLPSGQYVYTLTTPQGSVSKSMTLLK